jgi:ABC-type polysaccharide/polyol phosphate transport system ATPase subunit
MNSTYTSDSILKIQDYNLEYRFSRFRNAGLRDVFITALKSPFRLIMERERKIKILENINLEIKQGERVALIGVNGTGKTSLCRAIAGMHGKINSIKTKGNIRAIFDTSVVVHPELTGRENAEILVNLMFPYLSKEERDEKIKEAIKFSEIETYIDTPFKFYSKGMKSRLFLSVVSSSPSELLILDEVFAGADSFFNEKISKRITNMIENSGAAILISHHEELLKSLCTRGVVLHDKKVSYDGDIQGAIDFYNQINVNPI